VTKTSQANDSNFLTGATAVAYEGAIDGDATTKHGCKDLGREGDIRS